MKKIVILPRYFKPNIKGHLRRFSNANNINETLLIANVDLPTEFKESKEFQNNLFLSC